MAQLKITRFEPRVRHGFVQPHIPVNFARTKLGSSRRMSANKDSDETEANYDSKLTAILTPT